MQYTGINNDTDFGFTDHTTMSITADIHYPRDCCGCCCCKCDYGDLDKRFELNGDSEPMASVDDGFVGDFDIVI